MSVTRECSLRHSSIDFGVHGLSVLPSYAKPCTDIQSSRPPSKAVPSYSHLSRESESDLRRSKFHAWSAHAGRKRTPTRLSRLRSPTTGRFFELFSNFISNWPRSIEYAVPFYTAWPPEVAIRVSSLQGTTRQGEGCSRRLLCFPRFLVVAQLSSC